MATESMIKDLESMGAERLKMVARGFGHAPKTGGAALELLRTLDDEQIKAALAVLPEDVQPQAPEAKPAADETTEARPPKSEDARPVRICLRKGRAVEFYYNNRPYTFSPDPAECTPCPPNVARHYKAFFEENDVSFTLI